MPITMYSGGQPWGGMPQETPRENWDYRFRAMREQRQAQTDAAATQARILADLEREKLSANKEMYGQGLAFQKEEGGAERANRLALATAEPPSRMQALKDAMDRWRADNPSGPELAGQAVVMNAPRPPPRAIVTPEGFGVAATPTPENVPGPWARRGGQWEQINPAAEAAALSHAQQLGELAIQGRKQTLEQGAETFRTEQEKAGWERGRRGESLALQKQTTLAASMAPVSKLAEGLKDISRSLWNLDSTVTEEAEAQSKKIEAAGKALINKMSAAGVDPEMAFNDIKEAVLSAIPSDTDYDLTADAVQRMLERLYAFVIKGRAATGAVAAAAPGLTPAMVARR